LADVRQTKATWEENGKPLRVEPTRADHAGETVSAAAQPTAQDTVQAPMQRLEKPAARLQKCCAQHAPQQGKRGQELQSHLPANESAQRPTAPGGIQGDKGPALVDEPYPGLRQAEVWGNGQAAGHGAPRLDGAKANVKTIGGPETSLEGKGVSAASKDQSATNREQGAQAKRDASMPAPPCRHRAPRFGPPERHTPPSEAQVTLKDCLDDHEQDCSMCPHGNVVTLGARRPQIGNRI
jgi:hypothetical protein